jgi:hypothetical protein
MSLLATRFLWAEQNSPKSLSFKNIHCCIGTNGIQPMNFGVETPASSKLSSLVVEMKYKRKDGRTDGRTDAVLTLLDCFFCYVQGTNEQYTNMRINKWKGIKIVRWIRCEMNDKTHSHTIEERGATSTVCQYVQGWYPWTFHHYRLRWIYTADPCFQGLPRVRKLPAQ